MTDTTAPVLARDSTDYSDTQFYADLRKAAERLNRMVREAGREHKAKETIQFIR